MTRVSGPLHATSGRSTRWALVLSIAVVSLLSDACSLLHIDLSGRRKHYQFEHQFNVESAEFRHSLDSLGPPMVTGNTAIVLDNGDEIFPAMTGAIRRARRSVSLESYIFSNDEAGRLFADALIEAARNGVEVRVLTDGVGGKLGSLAGEMKSAGVDVRTYRPLRPYTLYRIGKRTHRKILVIDGKECFTGGLGIDKRWLGNARNKTEWRDTQVQVTGPVVAQMQAIFGEDWTYTTGEILAGEKFYPKLEPTGSIVAQAIKVSRGDASSLSKMLYYVAIQSAEKRILIQNAYFLPDTQIRKALIDAVARGVDVRVMVPGRNIDLPLVRLASRSHYGPLLRGGVKIFEYVPTMLHNKVMVVDGIYSIIGSINFDVRSMEKNAEESLGFYDRDLGREVERRFEEDLKQCHPVSYREWRHRGLRARVLELLFGIWEPYY
jgi:cardiolipin synthase A/B